MNFLLKNLELELDEQHLLVGEKLMDEGKVTQLIESERNLWIAHVDAMEVEMQISPARVRACSCECDLFLRDKMCGHVAAGLLKLRKIISEKKTSTSPADRKKPTYYQRLTTSSILDNIRPEDLAAFVSQYAKSNRNFALTLKTRFAAHVPMPDSREKYTQLLDATIQAGRNKNDYISSAGSKQLARTVQELTSQVEDAIALEHFAEGWAALSAMLDKITPLLRKISGNSNSLREGMHKVFRCLENLLSLQIPPALRQDIWDFCVDSAQRPAYRLNDLAAPLLNVLLSLADDAHKAETLLEIIDRELDKTSESPEYRQSLLQVKILLLENESLTNEAKNFTLECLADPQIMLQTVEAADAGNILASIRPLVEKGLRLMESESVKKRLEHFLLKLARQQGDRSSIVKLARSRFLETKNFEYFENCKEYFRGDWEHFVQQLLADLIKQPDYQQNMEAIATLLARENRLEELLSLLAAQDSLDLFMRFDYLLLEKFRQEVFAYYDRQLKNYLADHLGPVSSRRVRQVLDHLRAAGSGKLAEELTASLLISFNNRITLTEDLEVF